MFLTFAWNVKLRNCVFFRGGAFYVLSNKVYFYSKYGRGYSVSGCFRERRATNKNWEWNKERAEVNPFGWW